MPFFMPLCLYALFFSGLIRTQSTANLLCTRQFWHGYDDGRLPGDPRTCLLLTTEKAVFCNSIHRGTQLYHSFVLIWNLNLASTRSLECSPGLLLFHLCSQPYLRPRNEFVCSHLNVEFELFSLSKNCC